MKLNDANKVYAGAATVAAIYAGADKVWPSGFDPVSLGGLAVWLDASQLALANGAAVTAWPNLGSGPAPVMEGTPAPTFRTNALNGLPVVRCTASSGRFRITGTGVNKDYTLVYVGRMWSVGAGGQGRVVCAAYPSGGNALFGYWTTYMDVAYVTGGGGFFLPDTRQPTTTAWRMYSGDCESVAVTPRLFSNGVLLGTHPTPPAADGWGGTFNISGYGSSTEESCDCEVAEALLYNRKLSDAERIQAETALRGKWGLP